MKSRIALIFAALFASCVLAQPIDSLWSRTFGGTDWDECYSVQQTSDGGYILAGYTASFGSGSRDFWLVKTDESGDSLWSRTFGGTADDECYAISQTSDGGYILGGKTRVYDATSDDGWLVKTDANGDSLWSRGFGGNSTDRVYGVLEVSDGYVIAGQTYSFSMSGQMWMVKTDFDGDSLWSRTYGAYDDDACYAIAQTSDGGYILAGKAWTFDGGRYDFSLVKTNASGDTLWSRTYGGDQDDVCYAVQQTSDGGYILGGNSQSYGVGSPDIWLVKTDAGGDSVWSRVFGGSSVDMCRSVIQTPDGGYTLAGYTHSFGVGNGDAWVGKVSADGDSLWSQTFGGSVGEERFNSLQQTADGGYIFGGVTGSFSAGQFDFWLVKTGPDPTSVDPYAVPSPYSYRLEAFPNPFNAATTLSFTLPKSSQIVLSAYDVLGRETALIADARYAAGSHSISWQCPDCASGVYLITLTGDGFHAVQKAVLLR